MKNTHNLTFQEFINAIMLFPISCLPAANDVTVASNQTIGINIDIRVFI